MLLRGEILFILVSFFKRWFFIYFFGCRRVNGLFKIATRLVSRRHACGAILELLGALFSKPSLSSPAVSLAHTSKGGNDIGSNNSSHSSSSPVKHTGLDSSTGTTSTVVGNDKCWWPLTELAAQVRESTSLQLYISLCKLS